MVLRVESKGLMLGDVLQQTKMLLILTMIKTKM